MNKAVKATEATKATEDSTKLAVGFLYKFKYAPYNLMDYLTDSFNERFHSLDRKIVRGYDTRNIRITCAEKELAEKLMKVRHSAPKFDAIIKVRVLPKSDKDTPVEFDVWFDSQKDVQQFITDESRDESQARPVNAVDMEPTEPTEAIKPGDVQLPQQHHDMNPIDYAAQVEDNALYDTLHDTSIFTPCDYHPYQVPDGDAVLDHIPNVDMDMAVNESTGVESTDEADVKSGNSGAADQGNAVIDMAVNTGVDAGVVGADVFMTESDISDLIECLSRVISTMQEIARACIK